MPGCNDTDTGLPAAIGRRADESPTRVAAISASETLTYAQLRVRADRLAEDLIAAGASPGRLVAVRMSRSVAQPVAVLAALKSGGCCVPLDPADPPSRADHILQDSGAAVLITDDGIERLSPTAAPDFRPGYVVYTSGSTGRPKGVAMPRAGLENLTRWQCGASAGGRTLYFAALGFDVALQEIFATWAAGGTLIIPDEAERRDPEALWGLLHGRHVERLFLPFVMVQHLAEAARGRRELPASLREVITAGEQLRVTAAVREMFARLPGCRLVNQYGPAETHVVTQHVLEGDPAAWPELPPVGKPVAGAEVTIDGEAGEILIGGPGLADGYVNRPELTAERFVTVGGRRVYRTGDLGRPLPTGDIEFLGRADRQVKVRGVRVEPGEVENALCGLPGVRAAAVKAVTRGGAAELVAFVVGPVDGVRERLAGTLPAALVPSRVHPVEALPLTATGKVDRDALTEPEVSERQAGGARGLVESCWREVLGHNDFGDAPFFEAGGNSLSAIRLQKLLRERADRPVPVAALYQHVTVAQQVAYLESQGEPEPLNLATPADERVAIVGMAGRFPGAATVEEFWANTLAGRVTLTHFSDDEVSPGGVPVRGLVEDAEGFDAAFFGMTPREAADTDPQHRAFLETAWAAFEDAGMKPGGRVGVFAGCGMASHLLNNVAADPARREAIARDFQTAELPTLVGNDKDYLATRVAHRLDLRGPAVTVQSACSTSLAAVALACDQIRLGRCDAALAGGVSVSFPRQRGYHAPDGSIASPTGSCRPFDAAADGTVFGEGVAAVVLKRLSLAEADGDRVYAVITGVGVNNDGAAKANYYAPGVDGQTAAAREALARAGVAGRDVGYVEAHGTGTAVGDPIEVAALAAAYGDGDCVIGSAKASVGHLETAAGVTGLIRAALALHHRALPPTANFRSPNPELHLAESPFRVLSRAESWQGATLRAAVNSLGLGGTNVHVVLEGGAAAPRDEPRRRAELLTLSAKTEGALAAASARLADRLGGAKLQPPHSNPLTHGGEGARIVDAAHSLRVGRVSLDYRRCVVADDSAEAVTLLRQPESVTALASPRVAFLFPGQGSQYAAMGRRLAEELPSFAEPFHECLSALDFVPGDSARPTAAQPMLAAVGYAVGAAWRGLGVTPSTGVGHSVGDYAAAALAGTFTPAEMMRLVARRAELVESLPPGAMLAVRASEADVAYLLTGGVDLAAVNGPRQCVLSGPPGAIDVAEKHLAGKRIAARRLASTHAFHSATVEPILDEFRREVERLAPSADVDYWARHLREPVRFADALAKIDADILLEVGPGKTLTSLARGIEAVKVASLPGEADCEWRHFLAAAGRLWCHGCDIDWRPLAAPHARKVSLPNYPFERDTPAATVAPSPPPPPAPAASAHLRGVVAAQLGVPAGEIDEHARFAELGLDSLSLTQLANDVRREFGAEVTFRDLFEACPTVAALAERVGPPKQRPARVTPALPEVPTKNLAEPEAWTPRHRRFVEDLTRRYTGRTAESKRLSRQHRQAHADPRTVLGFDPLWKEIAYPLTVTKSSGSRLWDVDGNEYIDLLNGFGPTLFGHSPRFLTDALQKQLERGIELGPMCDLAGPAAELFNAITGNERTSFVCTGSEAVQAALRAARTFTGRSKVAVFSRAYHGNFDEVLLRPRDGVGAPGVPGVPGESTANTVVLPLGEPESLRRIEGMGDELAAVLVEPVQSRRPELQPREFHHELRRITAAAGVVLIFDEVVTGFRLHPAGAQGYFGVRADLATYGKVVGNGIPVGVVSGRADVMDVFDGGPWRFGDDSQPTAGRSFFAGTFVRHPLAMAAVHAVLTELQNAGAALQERLNRRGDELAARLDAACVEHGLPVRVVNCGSILFVRAAPDGRAGQLIFPLLRERGVYLLENFPAYLSTAHTDADLDRTAQAMRDAAASLGGLIRPPATVPLTAAEEELWLAARLGGDALCAYNESCHIRLGGPIDAAALQRAFARLVERHESLRSVFGADEPTRTVTPRLAVELEDGTEHQTEDEDRTEFDLAHGPPVRLRLIRLKADEHLILLTAHHLVCDGWAMDILLRELAALYTAEVTGEPDRLSPAGSPADIDSVPGETARRYWHDKFREPPEPLDLPSDLARPAERTFRGARLTVPVPPLLRAAVGAAARSRGRTPFAVLLAAYHLLLRRLTGQNDMAIGVPVAGQNGKAVVGHAVQFLPLRADFAEGLTVDAFIGRWQADLLDALGHRPFTYAALLRELELPRDPSRPPLLSASFNVDPFIADLDFAGSPGRVGKNPLHFAKLDLHWNLAETADGYDLECEFNTDVLQEAAVRRWAGHYLTGLAQMLSRPAAGVDEVTFVTAAEAAAHRARVNPPPTDYPRDATVTDLFAAAVRREPTAVAVVDGATAMTYGELNAKANGLAERLAERGVGPGDVVALHVPRSAGSVLAQLAVLKAGAAYLPLAVADPEERRRRMVADAGVRVTLTADDLHDTPDRPADPPRRSTAESPAYVMFTSGSTGEPKGVRVPHRGVVRLLFGQTYADFGPDVVMAHLAPTCFDAATLEVWGPLLHGGRCVVLPEGQAWPVGLRDHLKRHHVNALWLTAGLFHAAVDGDVLALAGVRQLIVGGEPLSPDHVRRALARLPAARIINGYGPTEATTFTCCHPIPRDLPAGAKSVPLGRPLANTTVDVLDAAGLPLPPGAVGELCVGGDGLAIDYHNRPEWTAAAFVADRQRADGRLYRTGDLGRHREDGTLEFLGRRDGQVKLRGNRVELGEVEHHVRRHPGVADCAAVVREDSPGDRRLVAYVVAPGPFDPKRLRESLRRSLPSALVPSHLVTIGALPLRANGKLDRGRLPAPAAGASRGHESPRGRTEEQLAAVWEGVLGVRPVGAEDNFFDLGGHSMLAARLFAELRHVTGRALPLATLFRAPTVRLLAAELDGGGGPAAPTLVPLRAGTGDPVVCVPGVGGHVFNFRDLAPLLPAGVPVYGVQPPGLDGRCRPLDTVEALASHYLAEARRAAPGRALRLVGYSFGGLVAFEMARMLAAEGEPPAVAVVDADAPGGVRRKPAWRRLAVHWRRFRRAGLRGKLAVVAGRLRRLLPGGRPSNADHYLTDAPAEVPASVTAVADAQLAALRKYRPARYPDEIILIRSAERPAWMEMCVDDPYLGWGERCAGVDLCEVPGGHLDVFRGDGLAALADALSRRLTPR